ncbi:MAG TPA: hypothetical protein DDY54_09075 [Deltaproteobacteria bacterium]|nr:hypothetical protein [Deltaproteobacteria bacterium]
MTSTKKWLLAILGVVVVLGGASGFVVSYFVGQRVAQRLSAPVERGGWTLTPGPLQHQLGYFSSRTVVSDARLQLGKNELAIPEFTVTVQFDGAEVHAPVISGNLVQPEGLALKIGDARVQLPMDSLRPEAPLRKGSLTMRQVDLISAEGSFSLEGVAINATQAQHAVWDTLTVLVAKLGFDAPNVAVVAQSVRMQQNHDPLVENRLGVMVQLEVGELIARNLSSETTLDWSTVSANVDLEINGNRRTVFWNTLRMTGKTGEWEHYAARYAPDMKRVALKSGTLQFGDSALEVGFVRFNAEGGSTEQGEQTHTNFSGMWEELSAISNAGAQVEAERFTLESEGQYLTKHYRQLSRLLEQKQLTSPLELVNALYAYLEEVHSNSRMSLTNLSFKDAAQPEPLMIDEGTLELDLQFKNGVGEFELRPTVRISQLSVLQPFVPVQIPFAALEQEWRWYGKQLDVSAFQEWLTEAAKSEKPEATLSLADDGLRTFIQAQPESGLSVVLKTQGGPEIALSVQLVLDQPWPTDFSLQQLRSGSGPLKQALLKSSTLRVEAVVDDSAKLATMLDYMMGGGAGQLFLLQLRPYTKMQGNELRSKLLVQRGQASLNGRPDELITLMIHGMLAN